MSLAALEVIRLRFTRQLSSLLSIMSTASLTPKSLYVRFLLIILLPMILVQVLAVYMFYERHWSSMTRNLNSALAGEVALLVHRYRTAPGAERREIISNAERFTQVRIEQTTNASPSPEHAPAYDDLQEVLAEYIPFETSIRQTNDGEEVLISIALPTETLNIYASRKRLANSSTYIYIMWITISALLLSIVAVLFLKNQLKSIVKLTEAAEAFGKGQELPDFKPTGAIEIRRAALAFIEMRERIKRLLQRRTEMLAGISHDLRTPLTRIQLQAELLEQNEDVQSMREDIDEMLKMLQAYLDYVRGENSEKPLEDTTAEIHLPDYLQAICANYRQMGHQVSLTHADPITLSLYPNSFKRALNNILDNAVFHADDVRIRAELNGEHALRITIEDNGGGIPAEKWDAVFQPFTRLDDKPGGVGLGLAVSRDIIHQHGGEIWLDHGELSGACFVIELPR